MGRGRGRRGKRFVRPKRAPKTRVNHEIRLDTVRLVGFKEIASEVMPTARARALAEEAGLDLVEIGPDQKPPIVKIIDYGKYKFLQEKKAKEGKKNQHVIQVKEIKLRPKIDKHDYEIKLRKAIEFLEGGDKVKVSLRFRGREMAHPELGMDLIKKMAQDAKDVGKVDVVPKMEGRQIVMILAPLAGAIKKKPDEKPKEKTRAEIRAEKVKANVDDSTGTETPRAEREEKEAPSAE